MDRQRRYVALDGLRGAAAVLVVLFHMRWSTHFLEWELIRNGYLAVDLFFVLSGFVISANYADKIADAAALRKFLCLRFFRLYPLHLAVLTVLVTKELLKAALGTGVIPPFAEPNAPSSLVVQLSMLHWMGTEGALSWNTPSWSIGDEFAAYVAFGLLALGGVVNRRAFLILAAIFAAVFYVLAAGIRGTLDIILDYGLLRCLAGFFLGVAVRAVIAQGALDSLGRLPRGLFTLLEIAVFAVCLAVVGLANGAAVAFAPPSFVALVAVLQFDRGDLARLFATRPARFLGRVSYSAYMVHMPLFFVVSGILGRLLRDTDSIVYRYGSVVYQINPALGDLLAIAMLAVILALASVTHNLVEEPGRAFGRRQAAWPYSSAQSGNAEPAANRFVTKKI